MRSVGVLEAPSAGPGGHVCWRIDDEPAFQAAAATFLAEGAARGERLVYVADADAEVLRAHLGAAAAGVLLQPVHDLYEPGGTFDALAQVARYRDLVASALADGYTGLRVAADATALAATEAARRAFVAYELAVDALMAREPMTAMCAYRADVVGDGLGELFAVHPLHHGTPDRELPFHAFYDDATLRLVGEIDIDAHSLVDAVVAALETSADLEVHLDLGGVTFVDVRSVTKLALLSTRLAAAGRALQVDDAPAIVRRCAALLALDGLDTAVFDR